MRDGDDSLDGRLTWLDAADRILGSFSSRILMATVVVTVVAFVVTVANGFPAASIQVFILQLPWLVIPRGRWRLGRLGPRALRLVRIGLLVALGGEVVACAIGLVPRSHWVSVVVVDVFLTLGVQAVMLYRDIDRRRDDPDLRSAMPPHMTPRQIAFRNAMRHREP